MSGEFILRLDVVNGNRAVLDRLLDEEVAQRDVLCPGGVACDCRPHEAPTRCRCVGRNTVEPVLSSFIAFLLKTAPFIVSAAATSPAYYIVDCAVKP